VTEVRENESENRRDRSGEKNMAKRIESYKDLRVYQNAIEAAMEIF
jgi:hypothetical protein